MLKIIRYIIFIPIVFLLASYIQSNQYQHAKLTINNTTLNVEEATTADQQTLGLSNRAHMANDQGMLFIFNKPQALAFWMYEMKFPLDIMWVNSQWQIVHIEQNLAPCPSKGTCQSYMPMQSAQYVVEANAGFVKSNQIKLGDKITLTE